MHQDFIHKDECRICGSRDLKLVLDLGEMPPANAFLKKEELTLPEKKFPLAIYFCRNCSLVQLLDVVNPEILFKKYDYMTSASKPMVDHFTKLAHDLADRFVGAPSDLVVEIGGNDGVLLSSIKERCRVLNIDPAENIAELARAKGIETISDFFNASLAERVLASHGAARLVVANNVVAHIDELKSVFEGVSRLIGGGGAFVFEAHWVGNLIGEGGFDQIYHEHLCYFSLTALDHLTKQFGLSIFDVELIPTHGESLRVYAGRGREATESVGALLQRERVMGLDKVDAYLHFSDKVAKAKKDLRTLLSDLKRDGRKVTGYGAPAKGNTLLNYFGIGVDLVDFLTDTTPLKQGLYSPGMHIPVVSPEKIKETKPDYMLLLAWNYADAIIRKEAEYRERGGRFIIPVPEVRVI